MTFLPFGRSVPPRTMKLALSRGSVAFYGYLIAYFALKLLFVFSGVDLFTEEAQYWVWGQYPDWSYYSKPPLIGWVNAATDFVFPHSDRVVRLTALFVGGGTLACCYGLTQYVFADRRTSRTAVVLLSVCPFFILASTFFTTDTLLVFFWMLTTWLMFRALATHRRRDWMLCGVSFGLGCLSKYAMFFFLFVAAALWASGQKKSLYGVLLMLVVGLILFSPVVYWNIAHDWVSVRHLSALASPPESIPDQATARNLLEFSLGVLLMNAPFLLLFLQKSFRDALFSSKNNNEQLTFRLILYPMVATVTVFLVISIFKRTEVNWPAASYTSLPVVMAWAVRRAGSYRLAAISVLTTLFVVVILLFPATIDRIGLSRWLPVRNDGLKRMAGWKELAGRVAEARRENPHFDYVLTDSYHVASALAFYTRDPNIFCLNFGGRMNQFDLWTMERMGDSRTVQGIYVTSTRQIPDSFQYESADLLTSFPIYYRGRLLYKFKVYLVESAVIKMPLQMDAY